MHKILLTTLLFLVVFGLKPVLKLFRNTDTLPNKIGCKLYEFNRLKVSVDNALNLKKVMIKEGKNIVYKNKKRCSRIVQDYGHTTLAIYYDDRLIAKIGHFKTNNWFSNDYKIVIKQNGHNFDVFHKITGPNSGYDNFKKFFYYDTNGKFLETRYFTKEGHFYHVKYDIE